MPQLECKHLIGLESISKDDIQLLIDTGFSLDQMPVNELQDGEFEFYILAPASQTIQVTLTEMNSFPQGYQITLQANLR